MPSRRVIWLLPLLGLCLALAWSLPARAEITLRIGARATLSGSSLRVRLTTANQGKEAARRLSYNLFLGDRVARAQGAALLAPGASDQVEFKLSFAAPLPGSYGFGVRVDYHDPNGYPLSAVSWGLFAKDRFALPKLSLRGQAGQPWPGRPPALLLSNPSDQPLRVELSVLAPAEFEPGRIRRTLELAPGGQAVAPLELSNRAALSGSTYPLAGLASYTLKGVHYTAAAQALITVGVLADPLYAWRPWLWTLAGLLLAAMLALAWAARRRRARP